MTDCATTGMRFDTPTNLALEATFDGGKLTSDGGLAWLAEVDQQLGLCEAIAAHVPEWRRGKRRHSLLNLVKQRVFQVACGYEDQDDADSLRTDPLFKLVCGSLPETGEDLASQPTMSRLENAPGARACHRMAYALGELYAEQRGKRGAPKRILLDFDSTDDPTHGDQEGSYYHGYHGQHMYHPLVVFEGETGQLVTVVLRPGNTYASRGAVAILKRVVGALRGGVARGEDRDSGRRGLRGTRRLRVLRARRHRLSRGAHHQPAPGGTRRAPAQAGKRAPRGRRAQGETLGRRAVPGR